MNRRGLPCLIAALLAGVPGGSASAASQVEHGGLRIAVQSRPAAGGGAVEAELRFTDAASGAPVSGLRPAAWLQLRRSPADLEVPCEQRARSFAAGSLGARADIDLNAYRLLSLNQDGSLAFINPLVRIRNSRLEAWVQLPGPGHDWAHDRASHRLLVTLRESGQLALVDTAAQRLLGLVDLGSGSLPTRLALEADGQHAWVGLDGAGAVARIDLRSRREVARLPVGRGPLLLLMLPGHGGLLAARAAEGAATLIDPAATRVVAHTTVGAAPVALAWSEAAQRAVLLAGAAGELLLLAADAQSLRVDGRIALAPGALSLLLVDGGRLALVGNVRQHTVTLVDLARRQRTAQVAVAPWPDQMIATRAFAYVRSQTTPRVTLFSLDQARAGRLQPLEVSIGRGAPADRAQTLNIAPTLVAAPEGNGVYAAVAADAQIYRYSEGLMVPSGSLSNYRREPRALLLLDDSLGEREPGRFVAPLRPPRSGTYDVLVRNAVPPITACLSLPLQAAAGDTPAVSEAQPPRVRLLAWSVQQQTLRVQIGLTSADGRAIDRGEVNALLYGPGGAWQRRATLRATAGGRWQGEFTLPPGVSAAAAAGAQLLVQSPTHGLAYADGRVGRLAEVADARR